MAERAVGRDGFGPARLDDLVDSKSPRAAGNCCPLRTYRHSIRRPESRRKPLRPSLPPAIAAQSAAQTTQFVPFAIGGEQ
jgi:hypothetical protein